MSVFPGLRGRIVKKRKRRKKEQNNFENVKTIHIFVF